MPIGRLVPAELDVRQRTDRGLFFL